MCSADVLYVLKCQHGKYYVGRCVPRQLHARLMAHRMGRGSKWTQLHPAICIERARASWDPLDEDVEVIALMRRHGIEQVRGGSFVFPVLDSSTTRVLQRMLRHATGCCLRCGRRGHFAMDCG